MQRRLQGKSRKWMALAAVVAVAAAAWFTMDGGSSESAHVGWFVLDAAKVRIGTVLIILSFAVRILLMDRLSGRDAADEANLESAAKDDVE